MSNAEALADQLALDGPWRAAMLAASREYFVPDQGLASPDDGGDRYPIDRIARPEEWMRAVYSDASITTQRDDGKGDPADISTGLASSSISAPGIAFGFLKLLAPRAHDRVLEIGTGTGYTAAVLSARLGDSNITSIEIDPAIAERAAGNLKAAGFAPRLVVGDGADGYPRTAPYDRIHATCAVTRIPFAWIEQTRPGGVIVAPWQPGQTHGQMTRLTPHDGVAFGRFHDSSGYMMLRAQRTAYRWSSHQHLDADTTTTALDPRTVRDAGTALRLVTYAKVPSLGTMTQSEDDGSFSLLLFEIGNPDGSWAACDYEPGRDVYQVTQYGQRRLWEELADAYRWWVHRGSPNAGRFGLTVTRDGETIWIDTPDNTLVPGR